VAQDLTQQKKKWEPAITPRPSSREGSQKKRVQGETVNRENGEKNLLFGWVCHKGGEPRSLGGSQRKKKNRAKVGKPPNQNGLTNGPKKGT